MTSAWVSRKVTLLTKLGYCQRPTKQIISCTRTCFTSVNNPLPVPLNFALPTSILTHTRRSISTTSMDRATTAKSLFEDLGVTSDKVFLTTGAPGERHLQKVASMLAKASQHLVQSDWAKDANYLQYGPKQGSVRFREQLAKFLSAGYNDNVESKSLVVTSGATHGFHLVASVLLPGGAPVFVEDPTYFIAIDIAKKDLGRAVVPVKTDDSGVDLVHLENQLKEQQPKYADLVTENQPFWGMVYLVPTYHNPCGYCISTENCKALVQLARKYKVLIFCDDVYNLLHFDANSVAPARLYSYDKPTDPDYQGNVISNSSFSKILSPGLRLGWVESGDFIVSKLVGSNILWSAGSSNHYASEIVASALEMGLEQEYLKDLNAEYKDTVARVVKVLSENLPAGCTFNSPKGGYFIWIRMPEAAKSSDVVTQCLERYSVKALVGQMCSATGGSTNCIRISFSHYPADVLETSVQKLCSVITDVVGKL